MNRNQKVFAKLLRLAPDERIEVLRGLPLGARRRLLKQLADGTGFTRRTSSDQTTSSRWRGRQGMSRSMEKSALMDYEVVYSLAHASAESVAAVLGHEPAWVIRMVAGAHPWPWQREVVDRLPARLRSEVRSLVGPCTEPALQVARELVSALAAKLESGAPSPGPAPRGGFPRWVKATVRAATRWPGRAS